MDSEQDRNKGYEKITPTLIARSNHSVSRKQIDEEALKVLYRLHHNGFLAFLVGGSVRDLLLGKVPKDFDVATNAHPHEVNALFRNSRIIGRRFRLVQVFFKGQRIVEVSTFRSRSEYEEVETEEGTIIRTDSFGTPEEDAFRRDITINGLFYNIADFSIIDFVGGMKDLERGLIRTIGDPDERFQQDPVRMIRVIRHSARTGFAIDGPTYQALLRHREELKRCSSSRVRDEFLRDLKEGMACPTLGLMLQTGLLFSIFPDFTRAFGERNPSKEKARRLLLALFNLLDQLVNAGKTVPDSILLAILVSPLLEAVTIEHPFLGEKEQRIYRTELIRSVLHQTFVPYSFPKGAKEAAAQILIAQAHLRRSLHYGAIPRRMRTKKYFEEAVLFFGLDAQARGERVPHPIRRSVAPDFLPWWPRESKRRGRR